MTDQSNIFNQDKGNTDNSDASKSDASQSSVSQDSVFGDQLASIKNERGEQKYDDLSKALEGLKHSQEYIPQLKSQLEKQDAELAQLRELAAKQEAVEDVVSRLTASQSNADTSVQGLDEQGAAALFDQMLNQRNAAASAEANQVAVQKELVSKFGSPEAANKAVMARATELGTTAENIGKIASENPKMALELFKDTKASPSGSPSASTVSSEALLSNQAPSEGLKRPDKSLLAGATSREQMDFMKKIQEEVYRKHGIET